MVFARDAPCRLMRPAGRIDKIPGILKRRGTHPTLPLQGKEAETSSCKGWDAPCASCSLGQIEGICRGRFLPEGNGEAAEGFPQGLDAPCASCSLGQMEEICRGRFLHEGLIFQNSLENWELIIKPLVYNVVSFPLLYGHLLHFHAIAVFEGYIHPGLHKGGTFCFI